MLHVLVDLFKHHFQSEPHVVGTIVVSYMCSVHAHSYVHLCIVCTIYVRTYICSSLLMGTFVSVRLLLEKKADISICNKIHVL